MSELLLQIFSRPDQTAYVVIFYAAIYALIAFCLLHSLLATNWLKRWMTQHFPRVAHHYRLLYNIIAIITLIVPVYLLGDAGPALWSWPTPYDWLMNALALAAIAGFFWSLRYYNLREFIGLPSVNPETINSAQLIISPLHRYVRHPWYFFMLVLIWTREMNSTQFIFALIVTAYLVIGSRLEENKLIAQFGDSYRNYSDKVSGLIPLPWKILSRSEQVRLMAS
jgi:methanethiol S-methyltransferase